jgi:hypothetical protein
MFLPWTCHPINDEKSRLSKLLGQYCNMIFQIELVLLLVPVRRFAVDDDVRAFIIHLIWI